MEGLAKLVQTPLEIRELRHGIMSLAAIFLLAIANAWFGPESTF
jgi:hypothetical protein